LVDEAHGAHLILNRDGPKSSLALGADVVVQSFHKTMPAMTQTACLHFSKHSILSPEQEERILWYLKSLQTSSPSYVLMASIDHMLEIVENEGFRKMEALVDLLNAFYQNVMNLNSIKVHRFDQMDPTKIILFVPNAYYESGIWDGRILAQKLRDEHMIEAEYDSKSIVLLMTSICTTSEDIIKLGEALHILDRENMSTMENKLSAGKGVNYKRIYDQISEEDTYVYSAFATIYMKKEEVDVAKSVGFISAAYVIPYPPGIPILVPGERIKGQTTELFPESLVKIQIVKEDKINEI
jgi:arginine/lysine/ornithine decarboxylase